MNALQAIIRLYEIKETIEDNKYKLDYPHNLLEEFEGIKSTLLHSKFAFDKVQKLIIEVENKMNYNQ